MRQRAVGVDEAAVRRAGLDADLAQADQRGASSLERGVIAVHVGAQLVHVGVLAADLADLAAHRHGHALRLVLADERREFGRQVDVHLLLLLEGFPVEIHQRRRVDVDVVEAGRELFLDQRAQPFELFLAIGAVVFFALVCT